MCQGNFSSFSSTYVTSAIHYRQMKHRPTEERQKYPFASLLLPIERHQNQNRFLSAFLLLPNPRSSCNASRRCRRPGHGQPKRHECGPAPRRRRHGTAPSRLVRAAPRGGGQPREARAVSLEPPTGTGFQHHASRASSPRCERPTTVGASG
jgi:hypothetical protein